MYGWNPNEVIFLKKKENLALCLSSPKGSGWSVGTNYTIVGRTQDDQYIGAVNHPCVKRTVVKKNWADGGKVVTYNDVPVGSVYTLKGYDTPTFT